MMSLHGVLRCAGIAVVAPAGTIVTFEEVKAFHEDMYEVSFMVADLYEAYALLVFGRLALKVVRQSLLKGDLDETDLMVEHEGDMEKLMKDTQAAGGCLVRLFNPMTYVGHEAGSSAEDDDDEDPPGEGGHGEHGGGHEE